MSEFWMSYDLIAQRYGPGYQGYPLFGAVHWAELAATAALLLAVFSLVTSTDCSPLMPAFSIRLPSFSIMRPKGAENCSYLISIPHFWLLCICFSGFSEEFRKKCLLLGAERGK